ncbi:MAG TPA: non-canonical purine NTP pyrophosphatase [Vicinamibacterales bacterium]|nr:non-canonical purine NTP pyrophosphatase [Vicinamibacterales bacterium]
MTLLVATTNADKAREIAQLLRGVPVSLLTLADAPAVAEPVETGDTFEANARLKATYYDEHVAAPLRAARAGTRILTVAEDSGLAIDALDGEPGVYSARFLSPSATYPERFAAIEACLAARPDAPRTARFACALAVVEHGHVLFETRGTIEGVIAREAKGSAGFGYDPIFEYPPFGKTLAEVSEPDKLAVAHRGHAFRSLGEWLRSLPSPSAP